MAGYRVTLLLTGPLFERGARESRVRREIDAELTELGAMGQRMVVANTPRGVAGGGGGLWGSITTELRGEPLRREMRVFSSLFYAPIREAGRLPGKRPPTEALVLWVVRKLGIRDRRQARAVAFVIARKIGRVGYEGAFMFRQAVTRLEPLAQQRLPRLGSRIAGILGAA